MTGIAATETLRADTTTAGIVHEEMCCYPGEALCGQSLKGDLLTEENVSCPVCIDLGNSGLECARIRAARER